VALAEEFSRGTPNNLWQAASDADALAAVATRNQQAFAAIMERYYKPVYRVAWRLAAGHVDAEDVTQEAFLKLWNNPTQIRDAAALKPWLMRVASNAVMDRYRQKPMQDLATAETVIDQSPSAIVMMDHQRITRTMDAAIAELPDRQKQALVFVHFEQMTNIAAAASMEISVDALESLLARARRNLKQSLAKDGLQMLAILAQGEL
jgi:RNA polymerase sigma-70 factor (ECF subfamily)